jgi:hypothetical protein
VKFSDEDREALLSKPIVSKDLSAWKNGDYAIVPLTVIGGNTLTNY